MKISIIIFFTTLILVALFGCGGSSSGGSATTGGGAFTFTVDPAAIPVLRPGQSVHLRVLARSGSTIVADSDLDTGFGFTVSPSSLGSVDQSHNLVASSSLTGRLNGTLTVSYGGSNASYAISADAFLGLWAGEQHINPLLGGQDDEGNINVTIDANGVVSGTISRNNPFESVSLQGTIDGSNHMRLQWKFSDEQQRTAVGTVQVSSGHLQPTSIDKTLTVSDNGGAVGTLFFELNPN